MLSIRSAECTYVCIYFDPSFCKSQLNFMSRQVCHAHFDTALLQRFYSETYIFLRFLFRLFCGERACCIEKNCGIWCDYNTWCCQRTDVYLLHSTSHHVQKPHHFLQRDLPEQIHSLRLGNHIPQICCSMGCYFHR